MKSKIKGVKQHVEDILGIPTKDFGGLGMSVRDHRHGHQEDGGHAARDSFISTVKKTKRRKSYLARSDSVAGQEWLSLEIHVHDGHDIFVDVSHLDESKRESYDRLMRAS